jgi:hypothetical protein
LVHQRRAIAMTDNCRTIDVEAPSVAQDAQAIACPNCRTPLIFSRSPFPPIDACGFESYRMRCDGCRSELAGIIDPADDMLLLSDVAA